VAAAARRRANELAGTAFRQRRKTVGKSLRGVVADDAIRSAGIDPTSRPEVVAPEAWVRLAETA